MESPGRPLTRQQERRIAAMVLGLGLVFLLAGLSLLSLHMSRIEVLAWPLLLWGAGALGFGGVLLVRGDEDESSGRGGLRNE